MIQPDDAVFLADGADAFGAVRAVMPGNRPELIVNVEGAGDLVVPIDAVDRVVGRKVIVRWDHLDSDVQRAIPHALDVEDFPPAMEGEVDLEPPPPPEDDTDELMPPERSDSPPGEWNGRDVGSRYGAPPSVTVPRRK